MDQDSSTLAEYANTCSNLQLTHQLQNRQLKYKKAPVQPKNDRHHKTKHLNQNTSNFPEIAKIFVCLKCCAWRITDKMDALIYFCSTFMCYYACQNNYLWFFLQWHVIQYSQVSPDDYKNMVNEEHKNPFVSSSFDHSVRIANKRTTTDPNKNNLFNIVLTATGTLDLKKFKWCTNVGNTSFSYIKPQARLD